MKQWKGIWTLMDLSNISVNAQSSIRIVGEKVLYFDPFNVEDAKNDADIIFLTHEHPDHFQIESISKIMKENTVLVVPTSMEKKISSVKGIANIELLEPGNSYEICGLSVDTIPAYNVKLKPFHAKSKGWQGYLVKMNGVSYYIAGDTDVNEDIKKVTCDVALVPIGGMFTMDKKQAAEYILDIKPKAAIPTHYGSMVGSPADGDAFKTYIEKADNSICVELKLWT